MTARTVSRAGLVLAIAAAGCAACSSPTPGAEPSHGPSPTQSLTAEQVVPPLMQCFVNHDLIPASALNNGKDATPPSDSSTWISHGEVVGNERLGEWLRANEDVVVKGKSIHDWIAAVEANRHAWPTSVCGPMPGVR